jgi:dTDP-4-amino-4,6-dideoxygalactose transaminase
VIVPFLSLKDINALHGEEIREAVMRALASGWYIRGTENEAFEKAYAHYLDSPHIIGVANGLDALTLILRAYIEMGILSPRDEIITPSHTYIATILAITACNLVPVFVEPDMSTYQIDDSKIEEAVSSKTKAVMIVHLYGRCAYTEKIAGLCGRYGLKLIEDNAQAHGCLYNGRRTGSLGDAAGHSFYPGKNLGALGDGGAVSVQNAELAAVVRSLANYGSSRKYVFPYKGQNSRLDEIQAAALAVKLRYLDADNAVRKKIARRYIERINHPALIVPSVHDWDANVFHIFPVRTKNRASLQSYLAEHTIETLIHYPIPPHKQECYQEYNHLSLPITEQIHAEELSLPISPALSDEHIDYVIETINNWDGA